MARDGIVVAVVRYVGELDAYGRPSGSGSLFIDQSMRAPALYVGEWKVGGKGKCSIVNWRKCGSGETGADQIGRLDS